MEAWITSPAAELFARSPANPILTARNLAYPANTIFNPAAAQVDGDTVLLARVEDLRGLSHLVTCRSKDGVSGWTTDGEPTFLPDREGHPEEEWGVEDPRATWIDEFGAWAVVYTAYSWRGPLVSLAFTKDFAAFERRGSILPPEDKNAALFPKKIGDRWAILHRPMAAGRDANIWISYSSDLRHWGDTEMVLGCRRGAWWDSLRIGVCPPPMETPEGWLLMYHGVKNTVSGAVYRVGLALLDLEDPRKVIRRSDEWVLGPREPYERSGDVGNVVFPCGWILDGPARKIRVYYGAADTCIGLATADLGDLLAYLRSCPGPR